MGDFFNPRQHQSKYFARVPMWLIGRPTISPAAAVLYGLLIYKCDTVTGCVRVGVRELQKMMGLKSDRSIRNYINDLEGAGLIVKDRRGQNVTNQYRFRIHQWMTEGN